jgi:membrane protease YdiL (CAAX protease family)
MRKDARFVLICLLICAASLFIGASWFYRAFPEASIDFKVDRPSSKPVAERFLESQGVDTSGYIHASAFQYDNTAKVFLERELGLKRANLLVKKDVKLWRWGHRWFKPRQKEEIRAEVTTSGQIASFAHVLPEDAPGPELTPDVARSLAESFLVLEMNVPVDSLEYLDVHSEKLANRTDHVLTWKIAGINLKLASYRVSVTVQGDRIGGYREFVKIPEEWSRNYARLRSLNESASQFDLTLMALLAVGMIAVLAKQVQLRNIRWKTALGFGLICLVLQFLSSLNEFPVAKYAFDTASTYSSFISRQVLAAFLNALVYAAAIFGLTAGAEPIYRQSYPGQLSISGMFSWQAIRTRSFFRGSLAGITLTFFFFAYEIGFYLLAKKFGAWAPADVPYSDLLNTRFPWIFVLLGGFFPAVSEEWMFRAFSVPFLQKLLRHRWLAVLLASFIWGFGHANYPNQPFFIRGIEVGIVGLILSWAMFRFGILAPLIAHYSIDAFYSAFLLLRSGNFYLVSSGAITAGINLLPLLLAVGAYVWTRSFRDEPDVCNPPGEIPDQASPAPPRAEAAPIPFYHQLSRTRLALAVALLVVGIFLVSIRAPRFAGDVRFRIPASQAVQAAKAFLSRMGFNSDGYDAVAQPATRVDSIQAQYLYTKKGIRGLNSIYDSQIVPLAWQTRLFKPLSREEYRVSINPANGSVEAFDHYVPEEDPGRNLSISKAQQSVSTFIKANGYDLSRYELKETASENHAHRRDTIFAWEALDHTAGAVEAARVRLEAAVYGDKLGSWNQSVKIPEEWKRSRQSKSIFSSVVLAVRIVFVFSMVVWAAAILVRGIRAGFVRWSVAGKITAAVMLLELLNILNELPALRFQYDTQVDVSVYFATSLAQEALLLIGIGLAAAIATALVMVCYPATPIILKKSGRTAWGRDVSACVAATLGGYFSLQWVVSQMQYRFFSQMTLPSISVPTGLGSYLPLISGLRNVVLSAIFFSMVVVFAINLWSRLKGRYLWRAILLTGLIVSLIPASARGFREVAAQTIPSVLLVAITCLMAAVFLRDNCLAYPACAGAVALAQVFLSSLGRGSISLVLQGGLLWALMLGSLAVLWASRRSQDALRQKVRGIGKK